MYFIRKLQTVNLILFFLLIRCLSASGQSFTSNYLLSFTDTINDRYGYKNLIGDTIISLGKYSICFTDTFRNYAVVLKSHSGFVAIDRDENILYEVFPFDNGPDDESEGLFRILQNGKIGYADSKTGKIIIKPQFDCAHPFKKGTAKVSNDCWTISEGEHKFWQSNKWFYILKAGQKASKPLKIR